MVKRNNPGNIRKSASFAWQGEQPGIKPGAYVIFDTLVNGYRAMIKLLRNYVLKGQDTLPKILYKWAPPSDNNPTENYIDFVVGKTGIGRDDVIKSTDAEKITLIAWAMSLFEHGMKGTNEEIRAALNEAKKKFFGLVETVKEQIKENPKKSLLLVTAIAALIYFNYE